MKTITYRGEEYFAPDWANFVAMDGDGNVYAFENKPVENNFGQWEVTTGGCEFIGCIEINWRDSLEKV